MKKNTQIAPVDPQNSTPGEFLSEEKTLEEITGWEELGDRAEARQLAEQFLLRQESASVRNHALFLAMFDDDLAAAERHALLLYGRHYNEIIGNNLLPSVLGYAGHKVAAYLLHKDNLRQAQGSPCWYGLACRAWSVGNREESLRAALRMFQAYPAEPHLLRKMFLDSELRGLWGWMNERPPTFVDAIRWAQCPIEGVLRLNADPMPPRLIDFADLAGLPQKFQPLLMIDCANTKKINPRCSRTDRRLFLEYLSWETSISAPSLNTMFQWCRLLRQKYDELLPHMIRFCLKRGRRGTGRYLLKHYLIRHPETPPESFSDLPGLEYWTGEWRRLWEIDPQGAQFLIQYRATPACRDHFSERFGALPEELRNSGQGRMVWGIECLRAGNRQEALQAFLSALRFWPEDEQLHHNILLCFCLMGRWEEAEKITGHPGFLGSTPELAEFARRAVAGKKVIFHPPNPQATSPFPTPSFGFPHRREDMAFLRCFLQIPTCFQ
jgi:hypothetical protein